MKKVAQEFKTFLLKGNVVDLAVGIVIGTAFGKIVTSLVNDVLMPPIGILIGKVNFTDLKIVLVEKTDTLEEVAIRYGAFLQTIIDFLLIGLAIFFVVKVMNTFKKKEAPKPAPAPNRQEQLLEEIRDLLKERV